MSRKRRAPKKVKGLGVGATRQKTVKTVSPDQYVIFRSPRTGKIVKYKSDRKLIAEVRSKKSKKVVGYLNKFSKGTKKKPRAILTRRFTRTEISLKARQEVIQARTTSSREFEIKFNEKIIDQVRRQRGLIKKIQDEIDLNDEILFGVEVDFHNGIDLISPLKMYTRKDKNYDFLVTEIAIIIINTVRGEAIRTSPKKYANKEARKKQWQYYRKATVKINFGGFE